MWAELNFEFVNKGLFHRLIDVFDEEANHPLSVEIVSKFFKDAVLVIFLHHENQVGPTNIIPRDSDSRIPEHLSNARNKSSSGQTISPR